MICVITYPTPDNISELIDLKKCEKVVAVDQAYDYLIDQKIKVDILVGDLDSITTKEFPKSIQLIKLPTVKDITDTRAAIKHAYEIATSNVLLIGGIGGNRIEHFLSNIFLLGDYKDLVIINETNKLYALKKGSYKLPKKDGYISLLPWPEAVVSTKGFEYDLNTYKMDFYDDLGISNTWINKEAQIDVIEGLLIVIEGVDK